MKEENKLLIPKIKEGIVIDHIPAGLGPRVLELLRSYPELAGRATSLGLNYKSKRLPLKDMLKLDAENLPETLMNHISLVASGVTIKKIQDYEVVQHYVLHPPEVILGLARCLNPGCISNVESGVRSQLNRAPWGQNMYRCLYCERVMRLEELEIRRS